MIQVDNNIQQLIDEHNRCNTINTFFYNNPECEQQVALQLGLPKVDRLLWISRQRTIENELIDYVYTNLHNKQVRLPNGNIGTIKHERTRTFTNHREKEEITDNSVSFRWEDGIGAKDSETMQLHNETIALWIDVKEHSYESHLYTINNLTLV